MSRLTSRRPLTLLSAALLALSTLAASPVAAQQAGASPSAAARQNLERCVAGQLTRLAKSKTPGEQVAPAVVQHCDPHLQGLLSVMIQTGEAPCPTMTMCLQIARDRMVNEVYASYAQRAVAVR